MLISWNENELPFILCGMRGRSIAVGFPARGFVAPIHITRTVGEDFENDSAAKSSQDGRIFLAYTPEQACRRTSTATAIATHASG